MKRTLISLLLVTALIMAPWYVYSRIQRNRREASYAQALARFQRDLRTGMTREEVETYLKSQNVAFNAGRWGDNNGWIYHIKIGEDPGSLVCDPWTVYVALEFDSATWSTLMNLEAVPNPTDRLSQVHIRKVGTCI